ncbi:MAG: hypothetical protein A2639_01525 [Candidatus Staskawiczbacteria bacterium RIFCSPHIGHO2_01_FULL_34_27]|uniref:Uncharacterized protein n=1 Tax=Candidatus Staskawiczbacteria bacterium RIFCSPHIGHO2_01_FULL_34_27 TaxID=1802199 RepID=A0A1G2HL52_9BACT|nr:MAG: hypothetical protein A2639_01525 [Candidatus Staskawiczbacteria bacterium RIFCSPHIGHO2_01_FULL_34_27]
MPQPLGLCIGQSLCAVAAPCWLEQPTTKLAYKQGKKTFERSFCLACDHPQGVEGGRLLNRKSNKSNSKMRPPTRSGGRLHRLCDIFCRAFFFW